MNKFGKVIITLVMIISCFAFSACDFSDIEGDSSKDTPTTITMPYNSTDYTNWDIDSLVKHFQDLGFTNIEKTPHKPDDDNYRENIFDVQIKKGWLSEDPWEAGEKFKSDKKISIIYNQFPLLTTDNCPELSLILENRTEINAEEFVNNYDGRYVEFNAYVSYHTYEYTIRIIQVRGGDYSSNNTSGYQIYIGDRDWDAEIDTSVEVGDNVLVSGKIDASWTEYYGTVYVQTLLLCKR